MVNATRCVRKFKYVAICNFLRESVRGYVESMASSLQIVDVIVANTLKVHQILVASTIRGIKPLSSLDVLSMLATSWNGLQNYKFVQLIHRPHIISILSLSCVASHGLPTSSSNSSIQI